MQIPADRTFPVGSAHLMTLLFQGGFQSQLLDSDRVQAGATLTDILKCFSQKPKKLMSVNFIVLFLKGRGIVGKTYFFCHLSFAHPRWKFMKLG